MVSQPLSDAVVDHLRQVADWPDLEGTRYDLVEAIGRGGMGTVYRARDRELDREVALKVLDLPEPSLVARLRREARVLARLEHPGVVPVHDVGALADGRAFYAMKLVRGKRLDQHLAGEIGRPERLRVFERLCEAVAFAHARGVIHRDLKPQNVMVGAFGEVLVVDWGVAKAFTAEPEPPPADTGGQGTAHGTIVGTPGFMAPEQAAGDVERVDQRSDVYALGAILQSLWSAPWPRPLRAIAAKAMASDPALRYPTAGALATDVSRYLQQLPVEAYREGPLERAWRLAVKHRTSLLLVLAYMLMRVALLLFGARTR